MKPFYQLSYDEVLKQLNSQTTGLSKEDVLKQRETHGSNLLEESKSVSTVIIFLSQFKDFLVIILINCLDIFIFKRRYTRYHVNLSW